MRKLIASASVLALFAFAVPAHAASQLAIGGAGSFATTQQASQVASQGLAIGVAAGTQVNGGTAAGVAVNTPAGSLTAGIGQNSNLGASSTFTAGALGGSAAAIAAGANAGANVGGGFTNVLP